jgi:MFS family permease
LWILLLAAFLDMLGYAMVFPLLPFYAVRLGADAQVVGWMVASFSVAQVGASPLWGRFSDRFGRRPALLVGLFGSAVAFLIFGFADAVWLLFASRMAQGASGGTTGVMQAYVGDSVPPEERAKALGWLSAATNAGVMIGPAVGSLAWHFGTEAPGVLAALLCLVNLSVAWRFLPESRSAGGPSAPPDGRSRSITGMLWDTVRHPARAASRLIWVYALAMTAFSSMTAVLGLYLMERFYLTEATIGYVFVFVGGFSVLIRGGLLGYLVSVLGEVRLMRMGALLLAAGLFLYPLPRSFWFLVPVMALVPLGTAFLFPATSGLLSRSARREQLGQVMGVQQSFGGLARIVGPIVSGAAFRYLGPGVPFVIAGALVSIVALLALKVPAAEAGAVASLEMAGVAGRRP